MGATINKSQNVKRLKLKNRYIKRCIAMDKFRFFYLAFIIMTMHLLIIFSLF